MAHKHPPKTNYLTLISLHVALTDGTYFSGALDRLRSHEEYPRLAKAIGQALNSALAQKGFGLPFPTAGITIVEGLTRLEAYLIDVRARSGLWSVIRLRGADGGRQVGRVVGAIEPGRIYRYVYAADLAELARELRPVVTAAFGAD